MTLNISFAYLTSSTAIRGYCIVNTLSNLHGGRFVDLEFNLIVCFWDEGFVLNFCQHAEFLIFFDQNRTLCWVTSHKLKLYLSWTEICCITKMQNGVWPPGVNSWLYVRSIKKGHHCLESTNYTKKNSIGIKAFYFFLRRYKVQSLFTNIWL